MENNVAAIAQSEEYRKILDEFYERYKEHVSEYEYERAKEDPEHLLTLIRSLTDLYQRIGRELFMNDRHYHVWKRQFERHKQDKS
jgi:hypothetical protein